MLPDQIDTQIYSIAKKAGLSESLSRLIVAQARHETANYNSNVFKSCNNLYGYKFVNGKWQLSACTNSPEGGKYAKYKTIADSVNELIDWLKRREKEGKLDTTKIFTTGQYALALKNNNYYTDSVRNYQTGLNNGLKNIKIVAASGLGIVLLAAGIYFYVSKKRK